MTDERRLSVEQRIKTVLFFTETRSVVVTQMRLHAHYMLVYNTVTCRVVRAKKMTGSSSDDWIY
jgi:hypothetical protein